MWDIWWRKWQRGRFFSEYFRFPLSVSFHQDSILFPEGQKSEAWEISNKPCSVLGEHWIRKYSHVVFKWLQVAMINKEMSTGKPTRKVFSSYR
jgi:hypothetical protein